MNRRSRPPHDESSPMLDAVTTRTLDALGSAEPSHDFAQRLTATLSERHTLAAATKLPFRLQRRIPAMGEGSFRSPFTSSRAAFALAACALFFFTTLVLVRHLSHPLSSGPPALSGALSARIEAISRPALSTRSTQPGRPISASSRRTSYAPAASPQSPPSTANTQDLLRRDDSLDQQALDDFHSPSQPAPPLPLTAQERSVRLMLRHGEKHDLAQLDPAEAVQLANTERRSFQHFFDPDPSPELALELKKGNLR